MREAEWRNPVGVLLLKEGKVLNRDVVLSGKQTNLSTESRVV